MSTTDNVATNVRNLIRAVMGMPDGSVRPAKQLVPSGGQVQEMATVSILDSTEQGLAATSVATDDDGNSTQVVEAMDRVTVSINFYRGTAPDPAGIATQGVNAFDRVRRLVKLLQLDSSLQLMHAAGLGLASLGKPRDLTALVDATWESRGQVDLDFHIVSSEAAPVDTIDTVNVGLFVQEPGGRIDHDTITGASP